MAIQAPPRKSTGATPDGTAPPPPTEPRKGREALGRELGTAFYRTFPAMLIIIAVGLLVVMAVWAVGSNSSAEPAGWFT